MRGLTVFAVWLLAAASAGCTTWSEPAKAGEMAGAAGEVVALRVPTPLALRRIVVARDESYIVGCTYGGGGVSGSDQLIKWSPDGTVLARRRLWADDAAQAANSDEFLVQGHSDIHVVAGADLEDTEPSVDARGKLYNLYGIRPVPGEDDTWIAMNSLPLAQSCCEVRTIAAHPLRVAAVARFQCLTPMAWCPVPGTKSIVGAGIYPDGVDPSTARGDVMHLWYDGSGRMRTVPGALRRPGFHAAANERCAWISSQDDGGLFERVPLTGDEAPSVLDTGFKGSTALALGATGRYLGVVSWKYDETAEQTHAVAILYVVTGADLTEVGRAEFDVARAPVEDVAVLESRAAIVVSLGKAGGRIIPFAAEPAR